MKIMKHYVFLNDGARRRSNQNNNNQRKKKKLNIQS